MPKANKVSSHKSAPRTQISVDSDPTTLGFTDDEDSAEMDRREVFQAREVMSLGHGGYRTLPQRTE
jgi:hypothetical protein